ncbi:MULTISPECIES: sensor domain-containing diguanylate cyclase [unclassified Butyrivibrio]|uniref:sensor domain-containing diguanylate cyclase n=1 Tax=unclassified Butyrivibrio TaxID=2639466 RepID=UPI0003B6BBF9|nr:MULTISPECIES: GGDEF domain-containing protein [unclassified Butyrivibrio]MDC7294425.1 diguanylate cyclase [Butyrivibrio sp. DSM 10294]
MFENKRPLKKSIFIGCSAFIVLLCLVLSILTYRTYTQSLYSAYEERMTDIIEYVYSHIDMEDLEQCVETKQESEKFVQLTAFMDGIMEDFDVHYLYIVMPISTDPPLMMNVISADTAYGRATDPDGYYLGLVSPEDYEPDEIARFFTAMENDGITFFKDFSVWGYDYTGLLPLKGSDGEIFAVLCVDIEVYELEKDIREYTAMNVVLIVILGLFFISFFLYWMTRNITEPISKLEKSVVSFARISHEQKDPDKLEYDAPPIHTHNEVESLSNAVEQMSKDMKTYVKNIVDAEGKVEVMKTQVSHMDMLAYQDALTHVKNKAWYDKVRERINKDINSGRARFAIVMADLNNLKKINDTFGHEHGNDYIFGACHELCVMYDHSPVFRIGGDEFVILLENRDYDNREVLFRKMKEVFDYTANDTTRDAWERYSVAMGMAIYNVTTDNSMDDVFKRADAEMYKDKQSSKNARE